MPLMHSWIDSANRADGEFPLNNLPCGVFSQGGAEPRCGMAIGDFVLDVAGLEDEGLLTLTGGPWLDVPYWNGVMEAGPAVWAELRAGVTALLKTGASKRYLVEDHLLPLSAVDLHLPFVVAEYTDFYSGRHHAENVSALRGGAKNAGAQTGGAQNAGALPANWLHMPLGYNGRASNVVVTGTPVRRPWGQIKGATFATPALAPSRRFDFELELGAVVGSASPFGQPVTVAEADAMIFGYVLLNDWSARDLQAWEADPLGPFVSKSTATTLSAWIVMAAALDPFRISTPAREVALLPYLAEPGPMLVDLSLEVGLTPQGGRETVITRGTTRDLYFSPAQQLAHQTVAGCAMNVGDLLGSGTISGKGAGTAGSLLELSEAGRSPLPLDGATRSFLQDHDTLTLRAKAQGDGYRIGFGPCTGQILPALADPFARPRAGMGK
jgi:fumarylacetoacetase